MATAARPQRSSGVDSAPDEVVDGVLAASKALVGLAARSIASLGEGDAGLTLVQFRALLLIVDGRADTPGDLATLLEIHPSNATRLVDRLVAKDLVGREAADGDRRAVPLGPTAAGRSVVSRVLRHRRRMLAEILGNLEPGEAYAIGTALARAAVAAGEDADEPAGDAWRLGWVS